MPSRVRSLRKLPLQHPRPQTRRHHTPAPHPAAATLAATPEPDPSPSLPMRSGPRHSSSHPRLHQHSHVPPPPSALRSSTLAPTLARIPGHCRAHAPSASPCSAPRRKIPSSSPLSTAQAPTTPTLPPRPTPLTQHRIASPNSTSTPPRSLAPPPHPVSVQLRSARPSVSATSSPSRQRSLTAQRAATPLRRWRLRLPRPMRDTRDA